jgi:rhodanese-related sulfurtransferase
MARKWLLPLLIAIAVYVFAMRGLKGGPEITVDEVAKLLQSESRPVVIDLRDCALFDQGHLPGAICVPQAELMNRVDSLKLPKADTVILYGADEARVRAANRDLYESGYQGGLTLKGGLDAWRQAGQALQKSPASAKP